MENSASIEVKCECIIPFHFELVDVLQQLLDGSITPEQLSVKVPHRDMIKRAVKSRLLFIKIEFAQPVKRWRYRLVSAVEHILQKNVVGSIRSGRSGITLILL